jgi:hypothetical protein
LPKVGHCLIELCLELSQVGLTLGQRGWVSEARAPQVLVEVLAREVDVRVVPEEAAPLQLREVYA